MGPKDLERSGVSEVVPGKLYFAVLQRPEDLKPSWLPGPAICFSIDNELVYEPFYADFGPLNLACTYHFCMKLSSILQEGELHGRCVCFCSSSDPKMKPNAAVLLGAYLVLCEGWDVETSYTPLSEFEPFLPFRDPTCGVSTYHLSVLDCIRAVAKGKKIGWIDFSNFNVKEYEYFEQVENGDLNWIVPNKIVAFSGPGARRTEVGGYRTLVPEDYVPYFKQANVTTVIRLNKRLYDRRRFTEHGLTHHDLYFPDGSCPPERIVQRFLEILEESPGSVAVHCKAGLGRTGVLIGCYLMKNFRFTANEAIGYLRIVRPGSVIGPQQHFLRDMQSRMWKMGDALRRQRSEVNRNSRIYASPPITKDGHPTAPDPTSSLTSPLAALSLDKTQVCKTNTVGIRGHGINSHGKRGSARHVDYSNNSGGQTSSSLGVKNNLLKEIGDKFEMEANNEYRRSYSQDGMQSRPTIYERSARPVISRGSTNLSSSVDVWDQNRRPSSGTEPSIGCHYSLRPRSSSMQPNNADIRSVVKNKDVIKPQVGEGVCTQRTLNAAGQPRKVVVPISHDGIKDTSPRRRRSSSPLRFTENQG